MQKKFRTILRELKNDKQSYDFHYPVQWKELGLIDYNERVKYPMDLSTVKEKLPSYKQSVSFFKDINQIWENCKIYNREDSIIYKRACHMEKKTRSLKKKYFPKKHIPNSQKQTQVQNTTEQTQEKQSQANSQKVQQTTTTQKTAATIESKLNLAYQLLNLENEDSLILFLKTISEQCPKAAKIRKDGTLQINISNLDNETALNSEKVFEINQNGQDLEEEEENDYDDDFDLNLLKENNYNSIQQQQIQQLQQKQNQNQEFKQQQQKQHQDQEQKKQQYFQNQQGFQENQPQQQIKKQNDQQQQNVQTQNNYLFQNFQ